MRASERRLVNKPLKVLRDLKLTLSEYLVVLIICNSKVDNAAFKPAMLLNIWLKALGKYLEEVSCGAILRLSGICLKTEN